MPNVHSNYDQARKRYGKSVADAIWRKFKERYGERGNARNAVVKDTEHERLADKPQADSVVHIIDAIVQRS